MRKHKHLSIRAKVKTLKAWVVRKSVPLTAGLLVTGIITLGFAYKFSTQAPHVKTEKVAAKKSGNALGDSFSPTTDGYSGDQSDSDPVPPSGSDSTTSKPAPTPAASPTNTDPTPTPTLPPQPVTPPAVTPTLTNDGCTVTVLNGSGHILTVDGLSGSIPITSDDLFSVPTHAKAGTSVTANLAGNPAVVPITASVTTDCPSSP